MNSVSGYEQPGKIDLRKFLNKLRIPKSRPQSCSHQIDVMQLRVGPEPGGRSAPRVPPVSKLRPASCPDRPYAAAHVPDTNMLFVAVLTNCSIPDPLTPSVLPTIKYRLKIPEDSSFNLSRVEVGYNTSCLLPADLDLTRHRMRPHACKTHHPDEVTCNF